MTINDNDIQKLIGAVKSAGNIIENCFLKPMEVSKKDDGSLVTKADIASNKSLCDFIKREYPNIGLVTEELDKSWSKYTFAIDPLDGTKEFVEGVPEFTIMIGLLHKETPIFGLIYNPITKELFYGGKNIEACYFDGSGKRQKLITISSQTEDELTLSLSRRADYSKVAGTFPRLQFKKYVKTGSEGLRLMRIAQNKANLRVEHRTGIFGQWDLCAPQAILEASGGAILSFEGSTLKYQIGFPFLQTGFIAGDSRRRILDVLGKLI